MVPNETSNLDSSAASGGTSGESEFVADMQGRVARAKAAFNDNSHVNPPASPASTPPGGDVVLDGGPPLTSAEQWAKVKDLPAQLKAFSDRMKASPYFNPANPKHQEAVQDATLAFGARGEAIHAQDPSDMYYGLKFAGFTDDERNALVSVARRDGIGADVLMRLVGAANHVGPGATLATLKATWGLEFDARAAAVDDWLASRPALQAYAFALDEGERAQIAYAVNETLKFEGKEDAEIEELMKPGTAYWDPHHPNHAKAIAQVTALHQRRFSG